MANVVIKKCSCTGTPDHSSKYQDKRYGEGMRVCNFDFKKTEAVCTVCGKTHKVQYIKMFEIITGIALIVLARAVYVIHEIMKDRDL